MGSSTFNRDPQAIEGDDERREAFPSVYLGARCLYVLMKLASVASSSNTQLTVSC
jgi:hypothetical protein